MKNERGGKVKVLDVILKNTVLLINMLFAKGGRPWNIHAVGNHSAVQSTMMLCHVDKKYPPKDHLRAKSFPSRSISSESF